MVTPGAYTFTLPTCFSSLIVEVWGGGGGGGYALNVYTSAISSQVTVVVVVGRGGQGGQNSVPSSQSVSGGAGGNGQVKLSWL